MKKPTPRVVVIDHYDSFPYNLAVLLRILGAKVSVLRTCASIDEIFRLHPTHIVLSPGPGHPSEVSLFQEVLGAFKEHVPILGVCLGLQAIGLHFGASVGKCKEVMHGKISVVKHNGRGIFRNIACNPFGTCRYHSLAIVKESIQSGTLLETAWSDDGTIMGIESLAYPHVVGVQFHPESHFTAYGMAMLENFLSMSA